MVKDKRKKDAPTATETPLNPNSTTGNSNTLYRKSQVKKELCDCCLSRIGTV